MRPSCEWCSGYGSHPKVTECRSVRSYRTYAYYISNLLDQKLNKLVAQQEEEHAIFVVFLKDDMEKNNVPPEMLYLNGKTYNDLDTMVELASSSSNGFSCGLRTPGFYFIISYWGGFDRRYYIAAYHETKSLYNFTLEGYNPNTKGYNYAVEEDAKSESDYPNLGSIYDSIAPRGAK